MIRYLAPLCVLFFSVQPIAQGSENSSPAHTTIDVYYVPSNIATRTKITPETYQNYWTAHLDYSEAGVMRGDGHELLAAIADLKGSSTTDEPDVRWVVIVTNKEGYSPTKIYLDHFGLRVRIGDRLIKCDDHLYRILSNLKLAN